MSRNWDTCTGLQSFQHWQGTSLPIVPHPGQSFLCLPMPAALWAMGEPAELPIPQADDLHLQLTVMASRQWVLPPLLSKGSCCFSIFSGSSWHGVRSCVRGTLEYITVTEAKRWPAGAEHSLFTGDPEQTHGCCLVQGCVEVNGCGCRRDFQRLKLFFHSPPANLHRI